MGGESRCSRWPGFGGDVVGDNSQAKCRFPVKMWSCTWLLQSETGWDPCSFSTACAICGDPTWGAYSPKDHHRQGLYTSHSQEVSTQAGVGISPSSLRPKGQGPSPPPLRSRPQPSPFSPEVKTPAPLDDISFVLSFIINFKVGSSGDIALHINPRMGEGVVRNSFMNGSWGSEERKISYNPFGPGQFFDVSLGSLPRLPQTRVLLGLTSPLPDSCQSAAAPTDSKCLPTASTFSTTHIGSRCSRG